MDAEHRIKPQAQKQEPGIVVMDNGNRFHLWVIGITSQSQPRLTDGANTLVQ